MDSTERRTLRTTGLTSIELLVVIAIIAALCTIPSLPICAATPAEEQAFLATYKTAFEAKDEKTLQSFLYTKDADPTLLEFYKAMQSSGMGGKVTSIELLPLSPEDEEDAAKIKDSPAGKVRLPLAPTKKLVLEVTDVSSEGSSTSTSECFVAEVGGRLVVPVPAPVK